MAQSVGDNSCVNTLTWLCPASYVHMYYTPAERAFVLPGSLSEQTEHEDAIISLSVYLSVSGVLQLQSLITHLV